MCTGDNMPREIMCPRDNVPKRQCAPRDNVPQETIYPEEKLLSRLKDLFQHEILWPLSLPLLPLANSAIVPKKYFVFVLTRFTRLDLQCQTSVRLKVVVKSIWALIETKILYEPNFHFVNLNFFCLYLFFIHVFWNSTFFWTPK